MTITAVPTQRNVIPEVGTPGLRMIRSEFSKIFSTNAWWLFGLGSVLISGLALWGNMARAAGNIDQARDTTPFTVKPGTPAKDLAEMQRQFAADHNLHTQIIRAAGDIFTSGQFFGLVLVLILGALVMTNEFQYQTATATFLVTPHRTAVVMGKFVAGIGLGMLFWLVTQLIDLGAGLLFFHNMKLSNGLGEWPIQRALLLNAAGYLLWAVFGMGLGTLIRNQIGTIITGMGVYLVGYAGGITVFILIRTYLIHGDWVLTSAVSLPPIASQIMISPDKLYPQSAAWWAGALVMIGWSLLAGTIGVLLTRRRDIS